jgi:hypothetical protein
MNILVKVTNDLVRWQKDEQARIDKAVQGSLYDATYALYQAARTGLKGGSLGLPERQVFRNLKQARQAARGRGKGAISDVTWSTGAKIRGGASAKIPLKPLFPGVIYKVFKEQRRAEVGFIGSEGGAGRIAQWAEGLAAKHLPGYTLLYNAAEREKLHRLGIHLKKTTTSAKVPSRSIMDQVSTKHGFMALEKLADSFERKMAGERT